MKTKPPESKTLVYETVEQHHQIHTKDAQIGLKTSIKINVLLLTLVVDF